MSKKKSSASTAVAKKPAGKKTSKKTPKKSGGEHEHADTFLAIYDVSPGLVVLFDALIDHRGGSDKVTLRDVGECLKDMNETMARLKSMPAKTTLQKIEYLESLPK